jgi:amino acid transporter
VVVAGLPHAAAANFTPFAPFGMRGIFSGASVVFFAFIGFDTVGCRACCLPGAASVHICCAPLAWQRGRWQ